MHVIENPIFNGTLDAYTYKFINTHTLDAFADSIPFYYLRLLNLEDICIIRTTDCLYFVTTQFGCCVDINGDEDMVDFYAKGKYAWVALPNYWKVRMYIKYGEDQYGGLGTTTIQIGEYLVYYVFRSDGYILDYNFMSHIQKTDTPITPSSYLVYYGSSSTVPNTLTTEGYQTTVVTGNSGSVAFAGYNYVRWIALPSDWTLTNVIDPLGGGSTSNYRSKVIGEYTLYYDSYPFIDTTTLKYTFSKSQ